MTKTIELKGGIARLKDNSAVLLPDELELQFKSVGYDLAHAFITLKNGETTAKFRLTSPFAVPDGFLHAGKLCGRIDAYIGEETTPYKSWDLLPIKIVETENGEIKFYDQLDRIEQAISVIPDLITRLTALEDKHKLLK